MTKVQPPTAPGGRFVKDRFTIDLAAGTITCPGRITATIRPVKRGGGVAAFGTACAHCPLATQCTTATAGRVVTISPYEAQLARARAAQPDPAWRADYTATRPKVERKLGHLMRHRHGGSEPAAVAAPRSPPTSAYSPPRSTWPASPCSACAATPAEAGSQHRHDRESHC